uniref:Shak1 n=1 Tax=Mnemiopsis leidyi TaxID=27923 RepID=A0A0C5GDD2_MNELE|nr:Shak1 [Mnemiopsis leidyi]
MAYAARLQNQQSRELARIYAEEYDAEAVRSKLRREQQKRKQENSEDTVSVESAESEEPRKKLKTLLREKGFTFLIDDQRRVDGEIRTYPEEFSFDDIVKINVGGIIYETRRSTLKRFPETLLGGDGIEKYYCKSHDMYFFDRHRSAFSSILSYYQSGGLLCIPTTIHPLVFLEEARFYELGKRIVNKLEQPFFVRRNKTVGTMKQKIWYTLDDPASSTIAKGIAFFDLACIMTAIALICVKTLPQFKTEDDEETGENTTKLEGPHKSVFFVLETVCMIWFTMDLLLRFCVCPKRKVFCKNVLNWVDVVSIVPYYLELLVPSKVEVLLVIRIIRFTKIFRIFKLSRYFRGLIALGLALRHSVSEILVLFVFLFVAVLFFATVGYYSESMSNASESDFTSVIGAFWWAIVTITSVGYGDEVPKSYLGQISGALCAITGIIFVALPVPIIVSRFNYFLQLENEKCRIGADEDISIFKHPLYSSRRSRAKKKESSVDSNKSKTNNDNNGLNNNIYNSKNNENHLLSRNVETGSSAV